MKYQLLPLDPELGPIDFDTQSILDLALLGPYDKDAGVVYFDGVACLEPRPDKATMGHVRKLEAELLAMKAERDDFLNKADKIALKHIALAEQYVAMKAERDNLISLIRDIVADVDISKIEIGGDREEYYPLYWQNYVALHKIAAANEAQP